MFLALGRITTGNPEFAGVVKEAFKNRPHLVDQASGFIRMDRVRLFENPNEIVLMTYWENQQGFKLWRRFRSTTSGNAENDH